MPVSLGNGRLSVAGRDLGVVTYSLRMGGADHGHLVRGVVSGNQDGIIAAHQRNDVLLTLESGEEIQIFIADANLSRGLFTIIMPADQ